MKMNAQFLSSLLGKYRSHASDAPDPMARLADRYSQFKSTSPMDLAAVATSLALGSYDDLDPLALKAIRDTSPNFNPDSLDAYSDAQLTGIVNSAKGKYFEYLVVEKLNSGQAVGDVALPAGYQAQLADSMNQPGWDLRIVDEDGAVSQLLQLKATESIGYIHDTLTRYPDIVILTTDEVANGVSANGMVLDSHIAETDVEEAVRTAIDQAGDGFLEQFADAFDPLLPLLVIATTQGYQVIVNQQSVADALEVAKARATRSLIAGGAGAAAKVAAHSLWVAIPVAMLAGWLFDRSQNIDDLVAAIRKHNQILAHRKDFYLALASRGA